MVAVKRSKLPARWLFTRLLRYEMGLIREMHSFVRASGSISRIRCYKSFLSPILSGISCTFLYKKNIKYPDWFSTIRKVSETASKISSSWPSCGASRNGAKTATRARVRTSSARTMPTTQRDATRRNPTTERASGRRIGYERRGEERKEERRGKRRGRAEETRGVRKGARGKVPSEW